MSDVLNPVDAEREVLETANRIAKGVVIVSKAHNDELAAERAYKTANYAAYLAADGSIKDKEAQAYLDTVELREAWDIATVAHRRARDNANALDRKLSALQSVINSIKRMFGAAGVGER